MCKKILFVCDVVGATFGIAARGVVYKEYLQNKGWLAEFASCTQYSHLKNIPANVKVPFRSRREIIEMAKKSAIVYFIKIVDVELIYDIHNQTNAILVYDFYDTVWKNKAYEYNAILETVDIFVTEGTYLCDFLSRFGKPVYEIKSACVYDVDDAVMEKNNQNIVIGWLGSASTYSAVGKVRNALEKIAEENPDVELRIVGADAGNGSFTFEKMKTTYLPVYNHEMMIEELLKFDIGIFPPPKDEFDYLIRGPHKGVRYMGAKKPAVFYNYGDCLSFVQDSVNAVVYSTEEEFKVKVETLIRCKEQRERIGINGYHTVCDIYSVDSCAESLAGVLDSLRYLYIPRFHI